LRDHRRPRHGSFDITLKLKVVPLHHGPAAETGLLHVRRQQVEDNLDAVIEKALRKKVAKLVNTAADKRILLLERQHMNLYPERIINEIENQRASFPDLARVDEIWIIETIGYGTAFSEPIFVSSSTKMARWSGASISMMGS